MAYTTISGAAETMRLTTVAGDDTEELSPWLAMSTEPRPQPTFWIDAILDDLGIDWPETAPGRRG